MLLQIPETGNTATWTLIAARPSPLAGLPDVATTFPERQNLLQTRRTAIRTNKPRKRILSTTFDKVADIIAETSGIDRETITPESHTIDDLGIDSLDFLDIVFAIDKEFGTKIPLEKWTQEVNDGKATTEEYFVLKNLCAKIDELVAAKSA